MRRLRTGQIESRAGSNDRYFMTIDFANGMLRDLACYTLYPLVRMARSGDVSPEHLRLSFAEFVPIYTGFLGYVGLRTLEGFVRDAKIVIETAEVDGIAQVLSALCRYANRLNAWAHHYFPWNIGDDAYRFETPTPVQPMTDAGVLSVADAKDLITLTWEPLGISIRAELASDRNPDLCADFKKIAPFTVLQDHAMISGQSMYAWTPMLSTSPVQFRETIRDAPKGRLRFSQYTGQKIIMQYGGTTEDLESPVLGQVVFEDLHLIEAVGNAVWKSNYESKDLIWLTISLA